MATKRPEVTVDCMLVKETGMAYLIVDSEDEEVWIPKSQSSFEGEEGEIGQLTLPEWLAIRSNLV